jgi:8-oxo-dGTP pyrophosphatase MutT (NUDIX family)
MNRFTLKLINQLMEQERNPWKTLNTELKYDNPWIQVNECKVINAAGNEGIYGVIHFKNLAIGIVPLTDDGYTWIVGQYRYPLNKYSWEIPEGGGKHDVDPLISAQRELSEETGLSAQKWTLIQQFNTSNSVTDEKALVYLAQDLTIGEAHPDEDEELVLKKIHFNELYQMAINGEVTCSLALIAIFKVHAMIESGEILIKT